MSSETTPHMNVKMKLRVLFQEILKKIMLGEGDIGVKGVRASAACK